MSYRTLAVIVGMCTLGAPGPSGVGVARASEPRRVAIWPLDVQKLPKNIRQRVPEEIAALIDGTASWRVVEPDPGQRKALARVERRCKPKGSTGCAEEVGEALGVSLVFVARSSGAGKRLELSLAAVDLEAHKQVASLRGRINPNTWRDDVGQLVRKLLAEPGLAPSVPVIAQPTESSIQPTTGAVPPSSPTVAPVMAEAAQPPPVPLPPPEAPVSPTASAVPAGAAAPEVPLETIFAGQPDSQTPSAPQPTIEAGPASSPSEHYEPPLAALPGQEQVTAQIPAGGGGIGLSVSAGPLFLVPTAKVKATGGATLEMLYFLPLFSKPEMRRFLGLSFEGGWYPLSGRGTNTFSEYDLFSEVDEGGAGSGYVTTEFEVDWNIQIVPVYLGAVGRLSTDMLLSLLGLTSLPLAPEVFGRVGGAMAYGKATATLNRPGAKPFVTDNTASDLAWGFYASVGAGIGLGPGSLTLEYRYTNVRLDFEFPEWNLELGDIGGNLWRLAYRLDF